MKNTNNIKVVKFGGTSVADAIQIRKIKEIVTADPDRKFVVVSAPGKRFETDNKVTDMLYLLYDLIQQNAPYDQLFQVIRQRFLDIESELGVDAGMRREMEIIEAKLPEKPPVDYIASRGEYLNGKVIAAWLGFDYIEAAEAVKFSQKKKFLPEETNEALKKAMGNCENAVVPGFYGALPGGEIKTFSRGGSDITGALVARAAEAAVYENWTDVSGFLMADPRIVENPKAIERISYKELRELSFMGASVLHENAIYPVRLAGIPINIRNTNEPQEAGTLIVADEEANSGSIITGIAGKKDFTVISIYKSLLNEERGFLRRILSILEDFDVAVEHIPSGIDTVSLVIPAGQLEGKLEEALEDLEKKLQPESMDVSENIALIATVGRRMASRHGVAASLFTALSEAKINIRMIDQGSSEMNIIVGVENKDFNAAIQAIYAAFVD